jgi:hypothetical protein
MVNTPTTIEQLPPQVRQLSQQRAMFRFQLLSPQDPWLNCACVIKEDIAARALAATRRDRDVSAALDKVSWDAIHSLSHSSSRQQLAFLQIKDLRLSGWDVSNAPRGCPHCPSWRQHLPHRVGVSGRSASLEHPPLVVVKRWNLDRRGQRLTAGISHRRHQPTAPAHATAGVGTGLSSSVPLSRRPEGPFPARLLVWKQLVWRQLWSS